jgi:cold shock CspA family protein
MSNSTNSLVCQRCGRGFMLTTAYHDFLARRGVKVKVPMHCMTCFLKVGPLPKQWGKVKWFDSRKRYGFIAAEGDQDVFLHQEQILGCEEDKLHEGQMVRFHVHQSLKGPEAWNVELAEE